MKKLRWTTQNEATDADGGLLQDAESFAAERAVLKEWGCPDTDSAKLVLFEPNDRDESFTTAEVSDAMASWLLDETDAEDVNNP